MIDIEVTRGEAKGAVLAKITVAQHNVFAREADHGAARAVITTKMDHARNAERAFNKSNGVVVLANRLCTPGGEIVKFAAIVERGCRAAEKKQNGAAGTGDLYGLVQAIDDENGKAQRIAIGMNRGIKVTAVAVMVVLAQCDRIIIGRRKHGGGMIARNMARARSA